MIKKDNKWSSVFDRDTILHLRLPFSFFLMPVFIMGISQAAEIHLADTLVLFIALHLFIYPGSNIYNSYMDKDTGSIGGLKNPPPVTRKLYYASIVCDLSGLAVACFAGWQAMVLLAIYVAFSKAYSWHGIRLKKYAFASWLVIAFFQGGYTFMLSNMVATHHLDGTWFTMKNTTCMVVASLIIGGSYPLTQIYQHKEDRGRGDFTISSLMGIMGTFYFTLTLFGISSGIFCWYFSRFYSIYQFLIFLFCLAPVMVYFLYWMLLTWKNKELADFEHTMLMNKISAVCMVVCFSVILYLNHISWLY